MQPACARFIQTAWLAIFLQDENFKSLSRIYRKERLVYELTTSFTYTHKIDWMLPSA